MVSKRGRSEDIGESREEKCEHERWRGERREDIRERTEER